MCTGEKVDIEKDLLLEKVSSLFTWLRVWPVHTIARFALWTSISILHKTRSLCPLFL